MSNYKNGIELPAGMYIAFSKNDARVIIASSNSYNLDKIIEQSVNLKMFYGENEARDNIVVFNVDEPMKQSVISFLRKFQPYLNDKIVFLEYLKVCYEISRYLRDVVDLVTSGKLIFSKLDKDMNVKFHVSPEEKGVRIPLRRISANKRKKNVQNKNSRTRRVK